MLLHFCSTVCIQHKSSLQSSVGGYYKKVGYLLRNEDSVDNKGPSRGISQLTMFGLSGTEVSN